MVLSNIGSRRDGTDGMLWGEAEVVLKLFWMGRKRQWAKQGYDGLELGIGERTELGS